MFRLFQTEEDYIPYPSVHEVGGTPKVSVRSLSSDALGYFVTPPLVVFHRGAGVGQEKPLSSHPAAPVWGLLD